MKIDRLAACAPDLADHRVAPRIVQVGYDHLRAFARQCRRTRCTNPRCAARYDGNLALYLVYNVRRAYGAPPIPVPLSPCSWNHVSSGEMISGLGLHLHPSKLFASTVRPRSLGQRSGCRPDVSSSRTAERNVSRSSKPPAKTVSDNEVRILLERYRCPVPFRAVRTRFSATYLPPSCRHRPSMR
jgi:hypothetical protein